MAASSSTAGAGEVQATYLTPTKKAAFANAEAGPSRARPAGASPAYSSRRHSLYGIEDRIVIEPGSRCWKVGLSSEVDPRAVFDAGGDGYGDGEGMEIWDLGLDQVEAARGSKAEARRLIGVRVLKQIRAIYTKHLMTDPKARKVIVVENTYLPSYVKDEIAKSLFDNLKVYHSRPLFHLARCSPLAGRRLHRRFKALLRHHARYYPPPTSFSYLTRQAIQPVPAEIITNDLVQRIMQQACSVSTPSGPAAEVERTEDQPMPADLDELDDADLMDRLRGRYAPGADATDVRISTTPLPHETQGMGPATLVVPGWIRERAAEVLFDDEEGEAVSIPELVLQCISKLPVDLRPIMISTILVVGGTASLPGFIPRLHTSLLRSLRPPSSSLHDNENPAPLHTPQHRTAETQAWRKRHLEPYKELYPLSPKLAILNDPSPLDGEGGSKGGSAPRWRPGLMSWVGGSLAGALKTGGPEMLREEYDALVLAHAEKGEAYRYRLAGEDAFFAEMSKQSPGDMEGTVPPPSGGTDEVGGSIEDLLPGMALSRAGQGKRGWEADVTVGDWSRVVQA